MSKTSYRAVWISDTHLGSRDCQSAAINSFLKNIKCEYLYIVGDFIDIWQLKRKWHWPQDFNNVVQRVLKKAKKGTRVVYIPGNHDESFREYAGLDFGGVRIQKQTVHETLDGRKLLVMHGDEFDAVVQYNKWLAVLGSAAYDYLIYANRIVNFLRRRLGLPYWSLANYLKRKVKNAITYIHSYEDALIADARKRQFNGVVCGHIHQPVIKEQPGFIYCNTGDWVENCTALVETAEGQLEIVRWPLMHAKDAPREDDQDLEEEDEPQPSERFAEIPVNLAGVETFEPAGFMNNARPR
ncbi:MAG: UDP-2,3-diacylglucosamine diphosphatase [Planctomycetota bacterium]|nr:UDP-2,3-diacylglucosamine diphosphatase [Planctomycetota bacterium]